MAKRQPDCLATGPGTDQSAKRAISIVRGREFSRREIGGMALMALTVDDAVSESILEEVRHSTGADLARTVNLEK